MLVSRCPDDTAKPLFERRVILEESSDKQQPINPVNCLSRWFSRRFYPCGTEEVSSDIN
jgi:hypothetical protein